MKSGHSHSDFDYGKISITAKLVAFFRAFSDIPFAVDVADRIGAKEAFRTILANLESDSPQSDFHQKIVQDIDYSSSGALPDEGKPYAPLLEARYKSIFELILQSGYKQVIELASGFSLRGVAMTRDPQFVYVESDLPGLNIEKEELILDIRSKYLFFDPGNHSLATANALHLDELKSAVANFRRDQGIVIVNEGLLMYLSAEERRIVAENVRALLQEFSSGLWITPDFTTRTLADAVPESVKRFRSAVLGSTDRQLYDSAFESESQMNEFFSSVGFRSEEKNQLDIVQHLSSVDVLKISQSVIGKLSPRMRIWLLSPAS